MNSINPHLASPINANYAKSSLGSNLKVDAPSSEAAAPSGDSFQAGDRSEASPELGDLRSQLQSMRAQGESSASTPLSVAKDSAPAESVIAPECGECEEPDPLQSADRLEESAAKREAASQQGMNAAQTMRAKAEQLEAAATRAQYAKQAVEYYEARSKELATLGGWRIGNGIALQWNIYAQIMGLSFQDMGHFENHMSQLYDKESQYWQNVLDGYEGDPQKDLAEAKYLRQLADQNEKNAQEQLKLAQEERKEAETLRWQNGEGDCNSECGMRNAE